MTISITCGGQKFKIISLNKKHGKLNDRASMVIITGFILNYRIYTHWSSTESHAEF